MGAPVPASILQVNIWSESGWRSMERTVPTTTFLISPPGMDTPSTLEPERVMASQYSLSLT